MHSKADAITAITQTLQASTDPNTDFDIDALADAVYAATGGYNPELMDPADFWAAVEKHARPELTLEALDVGDIVRLRNRRSAVVVELVEQKDLRRGPVHYYALDSDGRPCGSQRAAHPGTLTLIRKVRHWTWSQIHAAAVAAPDLGPTYRRAGVPLEMGDTAPAPGSTKWKYRSGPAGGTVTYLIHPANVEAVLVGDIVNQRI